MATNNYFGFTHGGAQYSATAPGAAHPAGQVGYAVAASAQAAAAVAYGTQQAVRYDTPHQAAAASQGTYAAVNTGAISAYGYGQMAAAGYTDGYNQTTAAAKPTIYATTYVQQSQAAKPVQHTGTYQANPTEYQASYTQPSIQAKQANSTTTYSGYNAALYSATTMYATQQFGGVGKKRTGGWQGYKQGGFGTKNMRTKAPPKPQQLHYCDVCKISCAGPQTYREHLEGQKHKKRDAAVKTATSVPVTSQNRAGNSLTCQLCDVMCTGKDAYAAHIRGAKHQKVVLLHTKLGKPIPPQEPEVDTSKEEEEETSKSGIQPVGQDYIEETKSDDGKITSFNCKLCDCRFNDPNAKEMHMKGIKHRLQYKKKVNPDLVVDVKLSLRQRKIREEKMSRAALREDFSARRHFNVPEDEVMYWDNQRRYEEHMEMVRRGNMGPDPRGRPFTGGAPPYFQGSMPRRAESSDDRYVMARHSEICPKEEELQAIQRIVSHTESALKNVSDQLAETKPKDGQTTVTNSVSKIDAEKPTDRQKEDGRDNQLFSFQQDHDDNRILKGVMRVGHLAKGLLLRGDTNVELVVLCSNKPTLTLLKKVVELLPGALKDVVAENTFAVTINAAEAGLIVASDGLTVLVQFTSPIIREQEATSGELDQDVLSRDKCLQALAALRHTKWFQARALDLHSCVVIMRVLRDLCHRVPTWSPLSSWAMELLVEKVISSVPEQVQLSPGDALRRVMEATASGLLLSDGPGLGDPCEKDSADAAGALSSQQCDDLTCSAQYALRLIAYRQIYKVLGMDSLPAPEKVFRHDRPVRKRRHSGREQEGPESDMGKKVKTEGGDMTANSLR